MQTHAHQVGMTAKKKSTTFRRLTPTKAKDELSMEDKLDDLCDRQGVLMGGIDDLTRKYADLFKLAEGGT